ncbi:sulfite exporter TauE/SafE-domain-containing protein [Pelagophyceae sp. CCMP2097]|nr:sulfite exporter TauE/SafE-domain-containing protein [Pelagophyceae sp. CCMP2097]
MASRRAVVLALLLAAAFAFAPLAPRCAAARPRHIPKGPSELPESRGEALSRGRALAFAPLELDAETVRYAFMLPTAVAVTTACQARDGLAGIGGAALFSPVFLLVFPLLGPDYALPSPAAAVASALLTEVFGFASGLIGFARRGLQSSARALAASFVADDITALRGAYAVLMLGLAAYTLSPRPPVGAPAGGEALADAGGDDAVRSTGDFSYLAPRRGSKKSGLATVGGGLVTGLLGVGIGECVQPQLVRQCRMPFPVAAGTSVAVVVATALTAAGVQFTALAGASGGDVASVVPWTLVQWTIPGVLVGGQIAPLLAARGILSDKAIERFAASLFGVVGFAFAAKALQG